MKPRSVFLWHLHQPEYRDPQTLQPLLPWVRLHATRAYTDMAAALERHPAVKAVVNWAPSLILQLEAYVGGSVDVDESLAARPTDTLAPAERAHVLRQCFSVDWELWVKPIGRYSELLARRGLDLKRVNLFEIHSQFTEQDLRDLQVHFLLGWMGFAARAEEPIVAELIARERGFSEADKSALLAAQRRIAARILPRWRALAGRGQVEISCSPLFHPILPLLVDSESAARAMPQARLPPRFVHPDDAREQVKRGLDVAERVFGQRPVGMWPSEGSVSPEVLDILRGCGVRWFATDEGVLARSEPPGLSHRGPCEVSGLVGLFRDRAISDAVGFQYARAEPAAAAADLVKRLCVPGVTTVALDGENPWEHYPRSGEDFLEALYTTLQSPDCSIECVLPRDLEAPSQRVTRIHSGSWIDANFRIWIGHPEDNQAWALLGEARKALDDHGEAAGPEASERARQALFAAEGSDWFWWYGDDFTTENAVEFDALFRRWVGAAFRHLKLPPPDRLSRPIIAPHKDVQSVAAVVQQPRRLINPVIDGYHLGYYEWSGAGLYRPPQSGVSMYRGSQAFTQLLWGFSPTKLFLRLDPTPGLDLRGSLELYLSEGKIQMDLLPGGSESDCKDEAGRRVGSGRTGAIVELALDLDALELRPADALRLWLRVLKDGVEQDRLPRYGELEAHVPDRGFEGQNWQV